jgi:hypothetical protein
VLDLSFYMEYVRTYEDMFDLNGIFSFGQYVEISSVVQFALTDLST